MRDTEIGIATSDYTSEDLNDRDDWPSFSSIKIIKPGKCWGAVCKERVIIAEKIHDLQSTLESSDEQFEVIKQQHEAAKQSRDLDAQAVALAALGEHLERRGKIQKRINRLIDQSSPIKTMIDMEY
ncbi:hypothetical protein HGB25_03205 [Candidatus Saccharibacteria bacterium]|nr:hypothetical protein [Candidatus Saccharibacteria bacterium]